MCLWVIVIRGLRVNVMCFYVLLNGEMGVFASYCVLLRGDRLVIISIVRNVREFLNISRVLELQRSRYAFQTQAGFQSDKAAPG